MEKKKEVISIFWSQFNKATKIKHFTDILKEYQCYTLFWTTWQPPAPSIRNTESKEEQIKFKLNENWLQSEKSNWSPNFSTTNSDSTWVRVKEDNYT